MLSFSKMIGEVSNAEECVGFTREMPDLPKLKEFVAHPKIKGPNLSLLEPKSEKSNSESQE